MKVANNNDSNSLSHKFRYKRFSLFLSYLNKLSKPVTILDIGGTEAFWEMMKFKEDNTNVLLLNLTAKQTTRLGFSSIVGNATNLLDFSDNSVDVVFSNSVIEHLFSFEAQKKMADEIRRVGKNYFVQTPNLYFPIEPHWLFPFFQFLPFKVKVWLTKSFKLGHISKITDTEKAKFQVEEVRLLTKKEMQKLFPDAKIYEEKFLFFTKSLVAYKFS